MFVDLTTSSLKHFPKKSISWKAAEQLRRKFFIKNPAVSSFYKSEFKIWAGLGRLGRLGSFKFIFWKVFLFFYFLRLQVFASPNVHAVHCTNRDSSHGAAVAERYCFPCQRWKVVWTRFLEICYLLSFREFPVMN